MMPTCAIEASSPVWYQSEKNRHFSKKRYNDSDTLKFLPEAPSYFTVDKLEHLKAYISGLVTVQH